MIQITVNGIHYVTEVFNQYSVNAFIHFNEDELSSKELTCIELQAEKGAFEICYVSGEIILKVKKSKIQDVRFGADLTKGRIWN